MQKRGLSDIVATVLIILLAIAAVAIVWVVVSGMLTNIPVTNTDIMMTSLDIDSRNVYVRDECPANPVNNRVQITVSRGGDKADVAYIKGLVVASTGAVTYTIQEADVPNPLESKTFTFNAANICGIQYVSVTPVASDDTVGTEDKYILQPRDLRTPSGDFATAGLIAPDGDVTPACSTPVDCSKPECNGASCNDGNDCTVNDVCNAGICVSTPKDCNDGNPCTSESCNFGTCSNTAVAVGTSCGDGCVCSAGGIAKETDCAISSGDEDGDGDANCADTTDCPAGTACDVSNPAKKCTGGSCAVPSEDCTNGVDDGDTEDTLADCADTTDCPAGAICGNGCTCTAAGGEKETNCSDGISNDDDALIDCADNDCYGISCIMPSAEPAPYGIAYGGKPGVCSDLGGLGDVCHPSCVDGLTGEAVGICVSTYFETCEMMSSLYDPSIYGPGDMYCTTLYSETMDTPACCVG
jgi:hypothetical protein